MASKIFNYVNQKLNAEKLREIAAFNSDAFGGIISDEINSPFNIVDDNTVILEASEEYPVTLFGGGVLLNQTNSVPLTFGSDNKLSYLEVTLDKTLGNITTDELKQIVEEGEEQLVINKINFKQVTCDFFDDSTVYYHYTVVTEASGNPNINNYYEYNIDEEGRGIFTLSEDTTVSLDKVYYYQIAATKYSFQANALSTSVFSYFGNTIWLSNDTFIIPLVAKINGEFIEVVSIRSVENFEGLLSAEAYARLKSYVDGTFVWTSGGREPVKAPDGTYHKKGDIGELNITGDTIYNRVNNGTDTNPDYSNPVGIANLTIRNLTDENNDADTKLIVGVDGNITTSQDYVSPIIHGGTGATTKVGAKNNLGIRWGTRKPTEPGVVTNPQEGDIYLWIIE